LVEYNMMIAAEDDIVLGDLSLTTVHGADVLRNFVWNFFGCEECRLNFVAAYDACAHDRCNRLTDTDMTPKQWIQFPVWLYETHNSVNARLLREKTDRENRVASPEEEVARKWPPKRQCPRCWTDSGGWDEEVVYKFLRIEYWSEDFVSEEYRNDTGVNQPFKTDDDTLPDSSFFLAIQLVPLAIVLLLAATWYNQNSIRARTGRHKKIDDSLDC
jgi:Erv1 / Alr family